MRREPDHILSGSDVVRDDRGEAPARRAIHRGFARVRGCTSQLQLVVAFLQPSLTHPQFADGLTCEIFRNLVRTRDDARVRCGSFNRVMSDGVSRTLTMDGRVAESARDVMLPRWSMPDHGAFRFTSDGNAAGIELSESSAPVNLAVALRYDACVPLTRPADAPPGVGPLADVQVPSEQLVFDVYVHPELFREQTPRLVVRDTAAERVVPRTNNSYRTESCAFRTVDHFEPLDVARGADGSIPEYLHVLEDIANATRWPIERYRAFRATVRYPIYGSIVHAYFDREIAPTPRG
jgi:hypothetical protein